MLYELILIVATFNGHYSGSAGVYKSMYECFEARDTLVEEAGRPIVNYQAICILRDNSTIDIGKIHGKYESTF